MSAFACAVSASEVVTVDVGKDLGPVTYRASGFLHAMSRTVPGPAMVDPLKPQLFRMGAEDWQKVGAGAVATYDRVKKLGARMQIVISDNHGYTIAGWWPGDHDDWTAWDSIVEGLVKRAKSDRQSVEWDIWNEPNSRYFWGRDRAQFFETWKRAYQKIRTIDSRATIVGPSISRYDKAWIEDFLNYAKDNSVVPDLLSWHEFGSPRDIPDHVDEMRSFAGGNGIDLRGVSINECISAQQQLNPGVTVQYLAGLDRAGVDSACHACWADKEPGVSGCENQTLDGLLTYPERSPRASWWAYKAYADIAGRMVDVKPSETVDGIAGADGKARCVSVVLGRNGGEEGDVDLVISNMSKLTGWDKLQKAHVTASRLAASGWDLSKGPVTVIDADVSVNNNGLEVILPRFGPTDAFTVIVTPAG